MIAASHPDMSGGQVFWSHAFDPHLVTVTGRAAQVIWARCTTSGCHLSSVIVKMILIIYKSDVYLVPAWRSENVGGG